MTAILDIEYTNPQETRSVTFWQRHLPRMKISSLAAEPGRQALYVHYEDPSEYSLALQTIQTLLLDDLKQAMSPRHPV